MFLRTWTCALALTVVACLVPAIAAAEAGDGLVAGNLTLSPGVSANSAVDTNVFRQSTRDIGSPLLGSSLQLAPFLNVGTLNPGVTEFAFDGRVAWQQYLNFDDTRLISQSGLTADAGAALTFNRQGAFSFQLEERLQRTNEPPSIPTDVTYNRTHNRLGATAGLHPGGKVFQHYLSYDWNVYLHDELTEFNRQVHDFTLKNYWRFLPKTAAVLNADYGLVRYSTPTQQGGLFNNINSNPLRLTGGLSGLITNRLSLRLVAGWGWGFYDAGQSFTGLLTDVQVAYAFGARASEKNRIYLGYQRDFQDSPIANFATFHRPYAGYMQQLMNERLTIDIRAESMIRDYVGEPEGTFVTEGGGTATIAGGLNDLIFRASTSVDYNLYKWWSLFASYHFTSNFTDDVILVDLPATDAVRDYQRHLVAIGTTFRY